MPGTTELHINNNKLPHGTRFPLGDKSVRLGRIIDQSGHSFIYLSVLDQPGVRRRLVAAKVLKERDDRGRPITTEDFEREAGIQRLLTEKGNRYVLDYIGHTRLTDPTKVGESALVLPDSGVPVLVMALAQNATLASHIADGMSPLAIGRSFSDVTEGLAQAHDAGVVHWDMKPNNVLRPRRDARRGWLLADWGTATYDPNGNPAPLNGLVVSPLYMAPERVSSTTIDSYRADQFSIGVMLWQAASSGYAPYEDTRDIFHVYNAATTGNIRRLKRVVRDRERLWQMLPFEPLARRAMAVNPEDRFSDIREMGAAIRYAAAEASKARRSHRVIIPAG